MSSTRLYSALPTASATPGALGLNTSGAGNSPQGFPVTQIISAAATDTVITNPASSTLALILPVPPGGPLEQRRFKLKASGYVKTAQSSTATVKLWLGSSTTVGSDKVLASTGAVTAFSGTRPFTLEANLIYDSVGGYLDGTYSTNCNGVLVSEAVILTTPPINNSTNNTNNPVLSFVMSVAFGTATAPNTINVQDFSIEF